MPPYQLPMSTQEQTPQPKPRSWWEYSTSRRPRAPSPNQFSNLSGTRRSIKETAATTQYSRPPQVGRTSMEIVPSAERVQVSVGRKVNGVEQRILNVNIYKGTRLKHGLPYYYTTSYLNNHMYINREV